MQSVQRIDQPALVFAQPGGQGRQPVDQPGVLKERAADRQRRLLDRPRFAQQVVVGRQRLQPRHVGLPQAAQPDGMDGCRVDLQGGGRQGEAIAGAFLEGPELVGPGGDLRQREWGQRRGGLREGFDRRDRLHDRHVSGRVSLGVGYRHLLAFQGFDKHDRACRRDGAGEAPSWIWSVGVSSVRSKAIAVAPRFFSSAIRWRAASEAIA